MRPSRCAEQALAEARRAADGEQERMARLSLAQRLTTVATSTPHDVISHLRYRPAPRQRALHAYCLLTFQNFSWLTGELDKATERIRAGARWHIGTVASVEVKARRPLSWVMFEHGDYAVPARASTRGPSVAVYHSECCITRSRLTWTRRIEWRQATSMKPMPRSRSPKSSTLTPLVEPMRRFYEHGLRSRCG